MSLTLTLQQSAAVVGSHCWAERRLFELLGQWSALAPSAPATLALDRHAQHAAWRAGQWWDRLPVLAGVDRDALVAAGPAWRALDDPALAATVTPAAPGPAPAPGAVPGSGAAPEPDLAPGLDASGLARLAVAYRVVLPRLAVAYARHAEVATSVADGPVHRTLGLVRPDLSADWVEGEAVLQERLVDAAAVDAAAGAAAAAERLFVASSAPGWSAVASLPA